MSYWHLGAELDATVVHIKDHVGAHGCYLLGVAGDVQIRNVVLSLIRELVEEYSVENDSVYFVGTSKGGTSAIAYGLMFGRGRIIAGEPQYALGAFLFQGVDMLEWQRSIAYALFGRVAHNDTEAANRLIPEVIEKYGPRFSGTLSVLYGDGTGYGRVHIEPLVEQLSEVGLSARAESRIGTYDRHDRVVDHFLYRVYVELGA